MSHIHQPQPQLIPRIRRLKGQIDAIERAVEARAPCAEVLMLAASVRGAVNGLVLELIEDHLIHHVSDPATDPDRDRAAGAAELIEVMRRYLK